MADAPVEPLTLEQVKANLRVDTDAEDLLISGLITAAREYIEENYGLALTPRTVTETAQSLGQFIELDSWPVTDVTEIRYPVSGVMTPLADGSWLASTKRRPARVLPVASAWGLAPQCSRIAVLPVEIDVDAGYASPDDVPQTIKQAMHLMIAHMYTNRSAVESGARAAAVEIPFGVAELLRRWRLERV